MISGWRQRLMLSGAALMSATLVFQGCSFIKELLTAHYFGTSLEVSAYFAAWLIPETILMILAGSFGAALVVIYNGIDEDRRDNTAVSLLGIALLAGGLLAGVLYFLAPYLLTILYRPFSASSIELCLRLFRALLIVLVAALADSFLGSLLQAAKRFRLFAVSQIAAALMGLLVLVVLLPGAGVWALAFALAAAILLSLVIRAFAVGCCITDFQLLPDGLGGHLRTWVALAVPLVLANVIVRFNPLIDNVMGMYLLPGAIAMLHYAYRLYFVPYQLFSMSMNTVLYPEIIQAFAADDHGSVRKLLAWSAYLSAYALLPVVAIIVILAHPIITLFYQHGRFSAEDARVIAWIWRAYALGLIITALNALLFRSLVALRDTKGAFFFTVVSFVSNIILNFLCIFTLGGDYRGVIGIALSTSLGSLLVFWLAKRRVARHLPGITIHFFDERMLRIILAAMAAAGLIFLGWHYGGPLLPPGPVGTGLGIGFAIMFGLAGYGLLTYRQIRWLWNGYRGA